MVNSKYMTNLVGSAVFAQWGLRLSAYVARVCGLEVAICDFKQHIFAIATARTLITLDLDFASPFRFPPEGNEGIVAIRPPRPVLPAIKATLQSVLAELTSKPLTGMLWIVEPGRIRVYDPHEEADLQRKDHGDSRRMTKTARAYRFEVANCDLKAGRGGSRSLLPEEPNCVQGNGMQKNTPQALPFMRGFSLVSLQLYE